MNEPRSSPPPASPHLPAPYNPYAPPAAHAPRLPVPHADILIDPASRLSRIGAHLIDVVAVTMMMFVCLVVWTIVHAPQGETEQQIAVWSCFVPALLVEITFQAAIGQSLGKRLLGLRVVTLDGRPASFSRVVFLRNAFPGLLQLFCAVFGIVNTFSLFRADARTLHDRMAGTRVVRAR